MIITSVLVSVEVDLARSRLVTCDALIKCTLLPGYQECAFEIIHLEEGRGLQNQQQGGVK